MTQTKAQQRAAEIEARKREAFHRRVVGLTGHLGRAITPAFTRQAFEAGQSAEAFAAELASREPVGKAVHAQKVEAVQFAEARARDTIEQVRLALANHHWDINAAAPYPARNMPRHEYDRAKARYALFCNLTEADPAAGYQSSRPGEPRYVRMAEDNPCWGIERFVREAREAAAAAYDAFIVKLVSKVGPVACASLEGSHVWGSSTLTVTKHDGTTERWYTQQITNYTAQGNPYLQWPTRKLKD